MTKDYIFIGVGLTVLFVVASAIPARPTSILGVSGVKSAVERDERVALEVSVPWGKVGPELVSSGVLDLTKLEAIMLF